MMHTLEALMAVERQEPFPWTLVGVFPTIDQVQKDPDGFHRQFMYSVDAPGEADLWFDGHSIEQRGLNLDKFFGFIANMMVNAYVRGVLRPGDTVQIPLGIPNADGDWDHDADSFWWIGEPSETDRHEANLSGATHIVPVRWSSPLGFRDEPEPAESEA